MTPTAEQFEEVLQNLKHENGKLYWVVAGPKRIPGKEAGHEDAAGYRRIMFKGKMYLAHRLVYYHINKTLPQFIDHIDRNPRNNSPDNLRAVTHSQNMRNAKAKKDSGTQQRGISFEPRTSKYYLRLQGKHLGTFPTLAAAMEAKEKYNETNPY